jgi:hypothetical protein
MSEALEPVPQPSSSPEEVEVGFGGDSPSSMILPTVDADADDSMQNDGNDLRASGQPCAFCDVLKVSRTKEKKYTVPPVGKSWQLAPTQQYPGVEMYGGRSRMYLLVEERGCAEVA